MTFAVVTGGGTSGHVLPALAIADALVAAGHERSGIHYVGTTRGIENRLVPPTGYPHTMLDVVGLQRSMSRRNVVFVPKLMRATWQASRLLRRLQPQVVVNVGGYGSFPATFAARLARIPVVVVSYDHRPGLVSRLLARGAAATAVAFAGSKLPHAELTGAPVRREIVVVDRAAQRMSARALLGLPSDRFVVGVCCGSLGAKVVNDAVSGMVELLAEHRDLAVRHVVGERFADGAAAARDGDDGILYAVIGYEEQMPAMYAAVDLMVTRAGAGTIVELAAAGVPAVVVPWPGAAENHQLDNAHQLTDHGGAILMEQAGLTAARLAAVVLRLQSDPAELAALGTAAYALGAVHRSGKLVDLVERSARPSSAVASGGPR
jgi:UDP-N-acetylglucosamine--N-acetylmuramyl-(pentapeptide) pyrophosphoryl-undecaprenol N-acetylglucosamine transferase